MDNSIRIVFIGSGNLATQLSLALSKTGHSIMQVYSRTESHAKLLADKLGCAYTSSIENVKKDADVYILSVKDDAVETIARQLCPNIPRATFLHTAGSVPMSVFSEVATSYGVLYPMQTFSKTRDVDFSRIPCFVEATDKVTLIKIRTIAESITERVVEADTEKRKKIHLAAVLASNLANHCYRLAERVLEEEGIDFNLFVPLIEETARKVSVMSPREAQTGPMVRYDTGVMERQVALLHDERTKQIYRLMAESIHDDATSNKMQA